MSHGRLRRRGPSDQFFHAVATASLAASGTIVFLVFIESNIAINAPHTLLRHGAAARVTRLICLTAIFVVMLEFLMFDVIRTSSSAAGIGITYASAAMVARRRGRALRASPPAALAYG